MGVVRTTQKESNTVPKTKKSKTASTDTYEGYCVKCKEKRTFEGEVSKMQNGGNMAKGPCPECGTNVCRMLGKAKS